MTIGLLRGNAVLDVLGDGNGFLFFAFALVVIALLRRGDGPWLRRCFLAACSANGVVTAALIAAALVGVVSLDGTLRPLLIGRLDAGGVVGTMPNGAFRFFLGSGLYLQVGLALVTWELLRQPRRIWPWVIYAILWADVIGTYTRGLWIGAAAAFVVVLAFGSQAWRSTLAVVAGTLVLFGTATAAGQAFHWSLPDYVFSRGTTVFGGGQSLARRALQDGGFEAGAVGFRSSWAPVDSQTRSLSWSIVPPGRSGSRALVLHNARANEDDYVAQVVAVEPDAHYVVSAWLDEHETRSSRIRRLLVWDPVNGIVSTPRRPNLRRPGWKRILLGVSTGPRKSVLQIRLYAPRGTVSWDDVHISHVERLSQNVVGIRDIVPRQPASATGLHPDARTDVAGQVSNAYRAEQFGVLMRHIRARPVLGSGFGSIAKDYPYGASYAYELSYLDLLFKAGIVGLLLYLSFPFRLTLDALRARWGRLDTPLGVARREASVVVAIVLSILLVGATNPFLFAAFGLCPLIVLIAWLDGGLEEKTAPLRR